MDLDAFGIAGFKLKEAVMKILDNRAFQENLKPFGILDVRAPDIGKAKQTQTTQRFKVHLISASGEDLFTKVEFSRRGFYGEALVESVDESILRAYKLPPLLVSHYDACSTIAQKLRALVGRTTVQARDIFDLYVLSSQCDIRNAHLGAVNADMLRKAYERVFEVGAKQCRETGVSEQSDEDQAGYKRHESWEEGRRKAANFIEE